MNASYLLNALYIHYSGNINGTFCKKLIILASGINPVLKNL